MNKPNETRDHYETMARAALFPELVACLRELSAMYASAWDRKGAG